MHHLFYNNVAKLCYTLIIFRTKRQKWMYHHLHVWYSLHDGKHGTSLSFQPTVHVKCWAAATSDPRLHLQTCGLITVPTLIPWITGYGEYCKSVCIEDVDELKLRLKLGIHQAIDQWRVRLNACVDVKGKHFERMLHNCQQCVFSFETDISVLLQIFIRVQTFF